MVLTIEDQILHTWVGCLGAIFFTFVATLRLLGARFGGMLIYVSTLKNGTDDEGGGSEKDVELTYGWTAAGQVNK